MKVKATILLESGIAWAGNVEDLSPHPPAKHQALPRAHSPATSCSSVWEYVQ